MRCLRRLAGRFQRVRNEISELCVHTSGVHTSLLPKKLCHSISHARDLLCQLYSDGSEEKVSVPALRVTAFEEEASTKDLVIVEATRNCPRDC